jgi:hypothetical protein
MKWFFGWYDLWVMSHKRGRISILEPLPSYFPNIISLNFDRLPDKIMIAEAGLKISEARPHLKSGLAKFQVMPNGSHLLSRGLTPNEFLVISTALKHFQHRALFKGDDVWRDFFAEMIDRGIMAKPDQKSAKNFKRGFILVIMAQMHGSEIILPNRPPIELRLGMEKGMLVIWARGDFKCPGGLPTKLGAPIFVSSLRAADCCDSGLTLEEGHWDLLLDVSCSQSLRAL